VSVTAVRPDPFTLIAYDGEEIAAIVDDAAALVGVDPAVPIEVEVDEELFAPLVGHTSDYVDGIVRLWISGGNLEDYRRPRTFSPAQARRDFTLAMLRAKDRLSEDFAAAPPERELSRGERAAWDVYAAGRAARLGIAVRRQAQLYDYRMQHGFTDIADAAFERLWNAESVTWDGIREVCKETGATERAESRVPIDILREK
jgi:hypothetical protein